jgi:hypothetical protein
MIKSWKLEHITAIERPLPEFANTDITHNVEFTLHGSKQIISASFEMDDLPISSKILKKKYFENNKDKVLSWFNVITPYKKIFSI